MQQLIENETLSLTRSSANSHYSDWTFHLPQHGHCLFAYFELPIVCVVLDKLQRSSHLELYFFSVCSHALGFYTTQVSVVTPAVQCILNSCLRCSGVKVTLP